MPKYTTVQYAQYNKLIMLSNQINSEQVSVILARALFRSCKAKICVSVPQIFITILFLKIVLKIRGFVGRGALNLVRQFKFKI